MCLKGYFGPSCNRECEFPFFGQDCLQNCTCEKDMCNFQIGCKKGKFINMVLKIRLCVLILLKGNVMKLSSCLYHFGNSLVNPQLFHIGKSHKFNYVLFKFRPSKSKL